MIYLYYTMNINVFYKALAVTGFRRIKIENKTQKRDRKTRKKNKQALKYCVHKLKRNEKNLSRQFRKQLFRVIV